MFGTSDWFHTFLWKSLVWGKEILRFGLRELVWRVRIWPLKTLGSLISPILSLHLSLTLCSKYEKSRWFHQIIIGSGMWRLLIMFFYQLMLIVFAIFLYLLLILWIRGCGMISLKKRYISFLNFCKFSLNYCANMIYFVGFGDKERFGNLMKNIW